jgi:phospholipase/carboxylesterase
MIAIWRRPAKSGPRTPLVVVLHGRGDDEHGLLPVIERLPPALLYVSLRGLVDVGDGGFTWFENRGIAQPVAASLRGSVLTVRTWLDDVAPPAAGRPCVLLGFSAGMMMAGALLLDDPPRFAGAVLLSGALPFDCGIAADPGRLSGTPIFYGRGALDDVIPPALVSRSEAYLRGRSGADTTQAVYDHAHSISLPEIREIGAWLEARA